MTFRLFEYTFDGILDETPLPYGHYWKLEKLKGGDFRNNPGWFEILYRTRASYSCKHGHYWTSSWTMIIFRFNLNYSTGCGTVRMKRFGQRCSECEDEVEYYVGFCSYKQVWWIVQRLLLYILQRCYEGRNHWDADTANYIIPESDVPRGGYYSGSGTHQRKFCEACFHNRCQERFNELKRKK